jgi:hypothetical protein
MPSRTRLIPSRFRHALDRLRVAHRIECLERSPQQKPSGSICYSPFQQLSGVSPDACAARPYQVEGRGRWRPRLQDSARHPVQLVGGRTKGRPRRALPAYQAHLVNQNMSGL